MRQENISRALGAIDGRFIEEASAYSFSVGAGIIEKESASQMNNGRYGKRIDGRKLLRICLAAAVAAALLTVTAYAAVSIHTRRRQEIRQNMNIDASNTESYVEYAADDGGVTLLSAINDGEFQRVYVNISPVDMAEIKAWPDEGSFLWSVSEDCGGYANPVLQPGRSLSGRDEITEAVLQDAYDAETKTLTVQCYIPNDALAQLGSGTVELTLMRFNIDAYDASGYASRRDWAQDTGNMYGTVSFAPTEHEVRYISFGGAVVTDEETGTEVTLYGLELSPTAAVWRVDYDGAEELMAGKCPPEKQPYYIAIGDRICADAVLHLTGGGEFTTGGCMSAEYVNGEARLYCAWGGAAIDINAVESFTLHGTAITFTG